MTTLKAFKQYTEACTVAMHAYLAALRVANRQRECGAIVLSDYMAITDANQNDYEIKLMDLSHAYHKLNGELRRAGAI